MSNHHESIDSEFLIDLSEKQQETLAAGQGLDWLSGNDYSGGSEYFFLFQQLDINTYAESDVAITSDGAYSSQRSGYNLSQTTLAFGGSLAFSKNQSHSRSKQTSLMSNLFQWLSI